MQQDNNYPIQLFKQALEAGPLLSAEHLANLETLLFSFPQCGILHAIYARSGDANSLNKAAAWFSDSTALQKAVKRPESLPAVSQNQIIFKTGSKSAYVPSQKQDVEPVVVSEPAAEPEHTPVNDTQATESFFEIIEEEPTLDYTEPELLNEQLNEQPVTADDEKPLRPIFKEEPFDETQQLIVESIAASDYFIFDKAFADRNRPGQETSDISASAPEEHIPDQQFKQPVPEDNTVTRYHDDKMPYSFMWWLDKTRNKHSSVYQPFANSAFKGGKVQLAPEANVREPLEERRKEEELVERFIQEEPQIKPPDSSKLDNENKGRQSEEDHEELITETLARIYADQMLYSKAIAAYKILMLKNPEKRRYFASQIENLHKKIN